MGTVFRAERAQKGRYRAFVQCDIDVIGDESNLAEIEIIQTISSTLKRLSFKGFTVKINDRRILKALVSNAGFSEDQFEDIAITLDKLDKVGIQGVKDELVKKEYPLAKIEKLIDNSNKLETLGLEGIKDICPEGYENLSVIMSAIQSLQDEFSIQFDHTLVRGMGYYTSTIFEVTLDGVGHSIAGGGRYDKMIGKISGTDVPAVGFSIGYERIVDLLLADQRSFGDDVKIALLYDDEQPVADVVKEAMRMRETYAVVSLYHAKKKLSKQLIQLSKAGFDGFAIYGPEMTVKLFEERQ